jgi:hypothetical protein
MMPGWSATAESGIIVNESETTLRYCIDVCGQRNLATRAKENPNPTAPG